MLQIVQNLMKNNQKLKYFIKLKNWKNLEKFLRLEIIVKLWT